MFLRIVILAGLALSLMAGSAIAQDYVAASWPNMIRTMVRLNALDLSDQSLLDEYAIITECDLYTTFYSDDFKWNKVRQALKESVKINIATFPANYHYDLRMQLDRYDFASKTFRFAKKSQVQNVNTFILYTVDGTGCGNADVKYLPRTFRAVLSSPLYLEGLPLSEKDATALLERMNNYGNSTRIIYASYNLRTTYIEPFRRKKEKGSGDATIEDKQSKASVTDTVKLYVQLDSVGFYEDEQKTKLIYLYQP